ncbi:hypothetical protein ACX0HA_10295 [Flavobacterium hauense]
MKTIDIIGQRSNRAFTAVFDDGVTASLTYPKWYSLLAVVTIGESRYGIVPKGFWKSRYEIIKDEKLLFTITHTWNGCEIVRTYDTERPLVIKPRGFLKGGYVLLNHRNEVLLEVQSDFSWKKFHQDYRIMCNDDFGNDELDKVLALFSVYYLIAIQTAAAGAA